MRAARGKNRELEKAKKLFRKRKYTETIRLLEPQVFTYRENPEFYHYLGVSCLRNGDFAGAYSYLKRAEQLEPGRTDSLLALAVVHLKRMEIQECLRLWLQILEEEPSNRFAQRGLDTVKDGAADDMDRFFQTGGHHRLIPSAGFAVTGFLKLSLAVFLALALAAGAVLLLYPRLKKTASANRPEIVAIALEEGEGAVDSGEKAVFMLTEKEVRESFDHIKRLFETYRDNEARREINRLLLSNARRGVKDKAALFIPHIRTPSFADFGESFSHQEVAGFPPLYEGCFVRWKGRVSNLRVTDREMFFDFLAGYEDQKVLHGIVPARIGFAAPVDPAFAYEIIAKVVVKTPGAFSLDVVSIHRLGL